MSVVWVAGQRFAAGLEWQRGEVAGRAARRVARQRRRPWTVDVAGQTGFLDDTEGPEGTKPLAGAIAAFLRMQPTGAEDWIAFIGEDGRDDGDMSGEHGGAPGERVAVVRCSAGALLPDGDGVFASVETALEAVGEAAAGDVAVLVTPALQAMFPDAATVDGRTLREAAADVAFLSAVRTGGVSRRTLIWSAAAVLTVGAGASLWTNRNAVGVYLGLVEEQKERPKVRVLVDTGRFLASCIDELARREMWMAGFERLAVYCHSSYAPGAGIAAPNRLKGRGVLEVRWKLREPLSPRVYGRLAEQLLDRWHWAGVNDGGEAVAVSPLPPVLVLSGKGRREKEGSFRARVDGMFPLRGFTVEYRWGKPAEVILTTARPFRQAVSMIASAQGIEVLSVAFEEGRWRFEGRRMKPRLMFEDEFGKLSKPLASRGDDRKEAA